MQRERGHVAEAIRRCLETRSDDKKRARLNGIAHILSQIPWKRIKREQVGLPKRGRKHQYKDALDFRSVNLVPERY